MDLIAASIYDKYVSGNLRFDFNENNYKLGLERGRKVTGKSRCVVIFT